MLTFLFAIAAIWTLFWLIIYLLDCTSPSYSKTICTVCASDTAQGTPLNSVNTKAAANTTRENEVAATASSVAMPSSTTANKANATAVTGTIYRQRQPLGSSADTKEKAEAAAQVKAAREEARAQAAKTANASAQNNAVKTAVEDKHDQANVKPLFEAPNERDDLKEIKGIGVVMERTLNDLGITTYEQLAGFNQADIIMVSEALDASSSGFGDRINRDEWVVQAKNLTRKTG